MQWRLQVDFFDYASSEYERELIIIDESTLPERSLIDKYHIKQDSIVKYEFGDLRNKLDKGSISKESSKCVMNWFAKNGCKNLEITFTQGKNDTITTL